MGADGVPRSGEGRMALAARMVALLATLQLGRWAFESLAFCLVSHTLLANELVRIASYLLMTAAVLALARRRGVHVCWLPRDAAGRVCMGRGASLALAAFALLFAATPFIAGDPADPLVWAELSCAALATPLLEETLFRGYLWARLEPAFGAGPHGESQRGGWSLVLATALLFGLWHLGYADAVAWRIAQPDMGAAASLTAGLASIMAGKVLFGMAIGVVFGALRLRWGTCLPSGILHGIWNTLA